MKIEHTFDIIGLQEADHSKEHSKEVQEVQEMDVIGLMPMPADFRYRDVFLKGKPRHDYNDPFLIRHPRMPAGRRAKIFAPFDALRGFNEAVAAKNVIYKEQIILSPEEQEELDRRFSILHDLTFNGRMARTNRVQVSVTYYEACKDVNHEAYGSQGQYKTITGICWNVDAEVTKTILVDKMRIPMGDIVKVEAPGKIFETRWEDQSVSWDT